MAGVDPAAAPVHRPLGAYAALAASMALVGTYVALSRPLTLAFPIFALALLRFAIGAVAMLPWTLPRAAEAPLTRREHGLFFTMSFFGNFLFSICMLTGVSMTTATAAGVILGTLPAMVAVFSRLLLGERLGARAATAVALAIAGIVLLQFVRADAQGTGGVADALGAAGSGASGDDAHGADSAVTRGGTGAARLPDPLPAGQSRAWLGNALLVATVCCEALYVVIGKRLAHTRAPLRVSALINLWGLVLMLPLGAWQLAKMGSTGLAAVAPWAWALLAFYSLAASLASVWLWMTGLRHVPAHHAGVFTVALPIAATAVGVAFLGEHFTPLHGVALASAVAGVVLIATGPHAAG
jgi:drug/metabolite transporter (DMT)-like permease